MTLSGLIGMGALAAMEGALVALPRADALSGLGRLRSPAWGALLPGSIVLGTFGPQALPPMAAGLVVLAGLATPLLATAAVLTVARGPRAAMLPLALMLLVVAEFVGGWTGQVSASLLTGLGCLTVGVVLVRLIPRHYMLISVLFMCAADVTLLPTGAAQASAALMNHSAAHLHGAVFDHAAIGPITTDYPDLVLAAVLGGFVADRAVRRQAAGLMALLAAGYGLFLPIGGALPATVPICMTFVIVGSRLALQRRRAERAHHRSGSIVGQCQPPRTAPTSIGAQFHARPAGQRPELGTSSAEGSRPVRSARGAVG
jgi:hypothetical protein